MKGQFDNIRAIQPAGRNRSRGIRRSWLAKENSMNGESPRQIFEHRGRADGAASDGWIRRFGRQEQRLRPHRSRFLYRRDARATGYFRKRWTACS